MEFSQIHNYYEHLVLEYIEQVIQPANPDKTEDFFLDLACITLNHLPSRYVRHEVDMAFFLDRSEKEKMYDDVKKALDEAIAYLLENKDKREQ